MGYPDLETYQLALDKHLATIPPEQHDMVRKEWARQQRRHTLAKQRRAGEEVELVPIDYAEA